MALRNGDPLNFSNARKMPAPPTIQNMSNPRRASRDMRRSDGGVAVVDEGFWAEDMTRKGDAGGDAF
jgi:hypothetical protein